MERTISPHHPLLRLGWMCIPGPAIPIIVLAVSLFIRSNTRRRLLSYPVILNGLRYSLTTLHLLFYAQNVWDIFHGNRHMESNVLPLLEYVCLVIGEAVLQKSNFWLYTSVALGWILSVLPTPFIPSSPYVIEVVILVLSTPSALGMNDDANIGVTLSALSLFIRATFCVSKTPTAAYESSAMNLAGILVPVLARISYTTFIRTAWGRSWHNKLRQTLQSWLQSGQLTNIGTCMKCVQVAVLVQTLLIAGWTMSSFVWSCFRWRWLFSGQESKAPAWTVSSFFAGIQFFAAFTIVKWWRARDATADLGVFMQWQLDDCLVATWWTSFLFVLLWLLSEFLNAILGR
jgi:hypothetical protein